MLNKRYIKTILTSIFLSILILPISIGTISNRNVYASTKKIIDIGTATIDGISIRSKNSVSGKYLGSLNTGDKIDILQKTSNGWYRFKYKNTNAYVGKTFIKLSKDKTIYKTLNTGKVYNANKLTVRKSYSTKSKPIGYLKKGTKVDIVRVTSTNWYKIKYKNSYGYVKNKYIKLTKSSKKDKFDTVEKNNLNNFLFIGDSFTQRMSNTIKINNNYKVNVFAQGGSRPCYWLDKVHNMTNKNDVSGIVLLIGVNGVKQTTNIRDAKILINQIMVRYPDKKIYIQKVFPVGRNFTEGDPIEHNKFINKYNQELIKYCENKENIKIIDTTKGFVDEYGYLINTSDGLHIDESKNNDFYNNIFESIKELES